MGWMESGKHALMTWLLRAIDRIDLFSPAKKQSMSIVPTNTPMSTVVSGPTKFKEVQIYKQGAKGHTNEGHMLASLHRRGIHCYGDNGVASLHTQVLR